METLASNLVGFAAVLIACATLIAGVMQGKNKARNETVDQLSKRVDLLVGDLDRCHDDRARLENRVRDLEQENLNLMRDAVKRDRAS